MGLLFVCKTIPDITNFIAGSLNPEAIITVLFSCYNSEFPDDELNNVLRKENINKKI